MNSKLQDRLMSNADPKPGTGCIGHWTFFQKRRPCALAYSFVDETGETVALATIFTMVKKLDQN